VGAVTVGWVDHGVVGAVTVGWVDHGVG
jgi:hypothetical protein